MIKKLKICGFDFELKYSDIVYEAGDVCLGCCKSDENLIQIKSMITPQRENEVILHESLHAMSNIMNLELTENTINTLGVVLIDFIKRNDKFVIKILEDR